MKRIILLLGILLLVEIGIADIIYNNEYGMPLTCNNATDGTLLCSAATIDCYNSTNGTVLSSESLYSRATGRFYYYWTNGTGRFFCDIDCCSGAVDYSIPVWVRVAPLVDSDNIGIDLDDISGTLDLSETTGLADNVTLTLAIDNQSRLLTATGFSTHSATDVWELDISGYSGAGYAGTYLKTIYDNQSAFATTADTSSLCLQSNLTQGIVALTSATETQVDNIETDTAAQDTATELRTLLTGGDFKISTQTNLSQGIIVLTTTTENQIDAIETDTETLDTASELRTLLTGGDFKVATQDNISIGVCQQSNLTDGIIVLSSATEGQIDAIETDTEAMDTASELRTLLTGGNWVISTQTNLTAGIIVLTSTTETQIDNIEVDTDELQGNQSRFLTATGFETEILAGLRYLNLTANISHIIIRGDIAWITASGFSTTGEVQSVNDTVKAINGSIITRGNAAWTTADVSGLATLTKIDELNVSLQAYITANTSVILARGNTAWVTATGFETETVASSRYTNLSGNVTDIIIHGDLYWNSTTVSGLATQDNITDLETHGDSTWATATGFATLVNTTEIINLINALNDLSAANVWQYANRNLTWVDNVWSVTTRTLTAFTASWIDSECTDATELAAERDLIKVNVSVEADKVITQGDSAWATATGFETEASASLRYNNTQSNLSALDTALDQNFTQIQNNFSMIPDLVWDEVLTGATHNVPTSAGRRLRQIAGFAIRSETAQAGTNDTITLDAGASSTDGIYNRDYCVITEGAGVGQTRIIIEYNGTSKVATVNRVWKINPNATSVFQILANDVEGHPNHGYAQAGGDNNITLESGASSTDDVYIGDLIYISTGTGAKQARLITNYNGTTKVATVSPVWVVLPDSTSVYHIDYGVRVQVDTSNDKTGYSLTTQDWANQDNVTDILTNQTTILGAISGLNDLSTTDLDTYCDTKTDIDAQLNLSHPGNWSDKADVSNLPTKSEVDSMCDNATTIDSQINSSHTGNWSDIVDISTLADNTTLTAVKDKTDNLPTDPADDSDIDDQLSTILSAITGLNNITASDVWSYATRLLTGFNFPVNLTTNAIDDIDTILNSSHSPGNWSATGTTTGLSSQQNDTLYNIYNVTGVRGKYDQPIIDMLGYNVSDGNVKDNISATTTVDNTAIAGAVWGHNISTLQANDTVYQMYEVLLLTGFSAQVAQPVPYMDILYHAFYYCDKYIRLKESMEQYTTYEVQNV